MTRPMFHHRLLLCLLILLSIVTYTISDVDVDEFSSMLAVLRARDRHALFANAIVTSDVALDLLTATTTNSNSSSFTFFAPEDSDLYALDTVESASEYTSVLRCHVIPERLTAEDLRRLANGSSLPTLSGNRAIRISTSSDDVIEVNGVPVVSLGLFYGRHVAVHGLRGILSCTDGENNSNDVIANDATEPLQSPAKSPEISSFIIIPSPVKSPEIGGFVPSPAESPEIGSFVHGDDLFSAIGVVVDEEERDIEAIRAMSPADLRAVIEDEFDGDCSAEHGFDLLRSRSYCGAST